MPEWCIGIPVLVQWAAIAMFRMAAGGFAFAFLLCTYVRVHVRMCACMYVCMYICQSGSYYMAPTGK